MRKVIVFIVLIISLTLQSVTTSKLAISEPQFYYTTNVEHLFTHCLIAYPEIAFKHNNTMKKHYDADCLTPKEFTAILDSLYISNYALVSINECFELNNQGDAIKKKIKVPIGKKPIILSFDDVNYDQKKMGNGMVDKIILDANGNVATQTKITSSDKDTSNKNCDTINNSNLEHVDIRYDNEFVTIIEDFINHHPDFSIRGARGTINLTGYDGILGYRTSHTNNITRDNEILEAKKVVNKLKSLGWTFASHSYGHYHMKKISLEKFKKELELWKTEVEPIVGKTSIYVYPYGEWEVFENGQLCEKHKLLNAYGFKLFCGVGMKTFFSYLPNKSGFNVLFMDRKCLDGNSLRTNHKELNKFFNPAKILDSIRTN